MVLEIQRRVQPWDIYFGGSRSLLGYKMCTSQKYGGRWHWIGRLGKLMNDFSCHGNKLGLYPKGKATILKVLPNELTQLDLCWANSNLRQSPVKTLWSSHNYSSFPYVISVLTINKLSDSKSIKIHLCFLSVMQISWLSYYFKFGCIHSHTYKDDALSHGDMSVNLDISTQLFYLMVSMLRTSCGA